MKKLALLLTVLLVLSLTFTGCAAAEKGMNGMDMMEVTTQSMAAEEPAAPAPEPMEEEAAADTGASIGGLGEASYVENDRKLIYTSDYSIETKTFEESYNRIIASLETSGGFLASEYTYGTKPEVYGDSGRTAELTLRIPIEGYNAFLDSLDGAGSIVSKSRHTEDVTADYYDNEARIALYEKHYEKLMDYLDAATEMEEIMSIEREITDVLYMIDELKGNKRYMDDRIEYCTVNIYLREVVEYSEVATSDRTFGDRVSESFTAVLKWLGQFFESFAVVLIAALPVLAILAAIFLAIFLPLRAAHKKKKRLAMEKPQKTQKPDETGKES